MSSLPFTTATPVTPATRVVPPEMDTARYETGEVRAATYPRAITISLGALLLLAPLAFGGVQPWAWGAIGVIAAVLQVVWATRTVRSREATILPSPLYLPALLFFALGVFQLLDHRSLDPFSTRESLLKLGADLVLFFLAGQLWSQAGSGGAGAAHAAHQPTPSSAIALYTFGLAVFAILQLFSSNGLLYWTVRPRWGGWIFGPYVNHNHYAGLMEMLIPVSSAWAISATSGTFAGSRRAAPICRSRRALLAFLVLVPIASVLLSGSRGGCIALLAEAGILAAILLRRTADIHRRTAVGALLVLAASLLCFFLLDPGGLTRRLASTASLGQASEATLGDRLTVARDTLGIIRDHPWLGTGLGSFEVVYPGYRSFPTDLVWDHAHNDYLEAIAETGLAGAVLIAATLILLFAHAFRKLGERLRTPRGWIELGAALGCVGLLIHSLSDFNLHIPANAAWFAVCAGVATSHRKS